MSKNQFGSISSSDLIDAKLEEHQLCGSKHCPSCGHKLEGKPDWVGLPAGVKFDPTDQELIEHLEAKVEEANNGSSNSHPLIDEFIPTIEGVTRDGLSRHFFHRPSKAYTTGTRKRRKIQTECDLQGGETRWHKTGKTRPVMVNGKQKGCKKILVLYTNFGKNRKPEKTNWVMHQYHMGMHEEEREGELVVSKIFYQTQPRQCNWGERMSVVVEGNRDSGSGSCSSREVIGQIDEFSGGGGGMGSYGGGMDMQQLKAHDHFSFVPFRETFDEVGTGSGGGEGSTGREGQVTGTCEERDLQRTQHVTHHHHHDHDHHNQLSTATFHVSRPSHSISTIITSPPPLHHTSIDNILDDHQHSFHVNSLMLQNQNFQQHQQHHKMGGRSASGLEELIMGCTSSDHIKEESSITNPQETDWLKYSNFWPDPDNPDHHG
ncbi:hypothetical protein LguiA_005084 [Lonicera macranthoides]